MFIKFCNGIWRRVWWALNFWRFKYLGRYSIIRSPLKLNGTKYMKIGRGVRVEYKTWLAAIPKSGHHNCCLDIGDGSGIGHFNHIYATRRISIGARVLTADKVYISDNMHEFSDVSVPIINQEVRQIGEVEIGDGAWLGENVCVIGAKVGKQSIIGANSVVIKDIPDYCVAVGAPARIVKRYSFDKNQWLPTNPDGSFKVNEGIPAKTIDR